MSHINIQNEVASFDAWKSTAIASIGDANIKIMRMDGRSYPEESQSAQAIFILSQLE